MDNVTSRVWAICHSTGVCSCQAQNLRSGAQWVIVAVRHLDIDIGDREREHQDITQVVMRCLTCGGIHQERLLGTFTFEELTKKKEEK
jgi:hypothetical protein